MKKFAKLTSLACAVALQFSGAAVAGSFQAVTSESVGTEAASVGTLSANISGDSIVMDFDSGMSADNRLFIRLDNGATFADAAYSLEVSTGGAGNGDLTDFVLVTQTPAGATELEFRAVSALITSENYILSGSAVAGQAVNVNVPALAAGGEISVSAEAQDSFGAFEFFSGLELFEYANEFAALLTKPADAIVDVDDNRLSFTGGASSDTIELNFAGAMITNALSLSDDDTVAITLSGDMSGIASIGLTTDTTARGNFTIDTAANTATFAASASDVFAATSTILTANVTGSSALATRSFTVMADLDFETETDKNLIAENSPAGAWSINGLQAKVSHMSLNSTGFVSWLKVANEGTTAAEISADIIYTLADGTEGSVTNATLGTVDAGGVATVGEAAILSAIGEPTQLVDASLTVTVAGQTNLIHLIAEKKASDGRLPIPVYYNTGGATPRNWVN